jgi:hypothetical protein
MSRLMSYAVGGLHLVSLAGLAYAGPPLIHPATEVFAGTSWALTHNWQEPSIGVTPANPYEVVVAAMMSPAATGSMDFGYAWSSNAAMSFQGHGVWSQVAGVCTADTLNDPTIVADGSGFWIGGLGHGSVFFVARKALGQNVGTPFVVHCPSPAGGKDDKPLLAVGPNPGGAPGRSLYLSFHADPLPKEVGQVLVWDPLHSPVHPATNQPEGFARPWARRSSPANVANLGDPGTWDPPAKVLRPSPNPYDPLDEYWGRTVAPVVIQGGNNAGRLVLAVTDVVTHNPWSPFHPTSPGCWNNHCRPYVVHSNDGGQIWSDPPAHLGPTSAQIVNPLYPGPQNDPLNRGSWPDIAVDPVQHDHVYVIYTAFDTGTGSYDIYIAKSTDAGATFPAFDTLHLTDALLFPGLPLRDQSYASITIDSVEECGQGISILFWQNDGNGLYRPYYARITGTFAQPSIFVGPLMPNAFPVAAPGHYQKITSVKSMVYAAFPARVPVDGEWSNRKLFVSHIRTCIPDTDGDGAITTNDVSEFATLFASGSPLVDLNQDGHVDVSDAAIFTQAFTTGCGP